MGRYSIKNIALGIGIGMILASVLNISFNRREMTVQDIKNEAQKHNLIIMSPNELINKNESNNNIPANDTKIEGARSINLVEVLIERGSTSETVAAQLKELGLIKDENSFINELSRQNKNRKIQFGKYYIKNGIEIEELIRILTTAK